MEVDWLASNLRHVERPQHARDGEPYLALDDKHPRAYPPPGTKHPVISLVRVAQLGADGRTEGIIDIAIGLQTVNARSRYTMRRGNRGQARAYVKVHRPFPSVGVVMHCPRVQYDDRAFWDTMLAVNKTPTRHMRRAEPERVVATLDFFDDSPTVR
jgi:hypothetical protein